MIVREKLQLYLEIKTCDPLNYTMDHSKFIASIQKEEFISSFKSSAGPCSAVGNVSGYRCEAGCRSRGREFDPSLVPYFRGD